MISSIECFLVMGINAKERFGCPYPGSSEAECFSRIDLFSLLALSLKLRALSYKTNNSNFFLHQGLLSWLINFVGLGVVEDYKTVK
jgi:hypothetical protein